MAEAALTRTPHDAFCKEVLSDPKVAAALFRPRLPQDISNRINWSALALEPSSFVKSSLLQLHSDLLFSAQAGGRKVLLYVLLEHQSTVDKFMPLRLLAYRIEIWLDHVSKNPDNPLPLPHVIPFVFHQGPEEWHVSPYFEDMFDLADDLACLLPFVPRFRHELFDLTQFEPRDEEQDTILRMVLEMMKRIRRKNEMLGFWAWLGWEIPDDPFPADLLRAMLAYAWSVDNSIDAEGIARTVEHNPRLRSSVMTYMEKLIAKGEAKGKAEGEVKGVWIGKIQMLEQMMGLQVSAAETFSGLEAAELQERFEALERTYSHQFKSKD